MSLTSTSPTSPKKNRQLGFTLLELMVSLALFAMGVVSLLVVKDHSLEEAYMARRLHLARLLGQAMMEDLILGTRDYEDGESGDVWSLDGEDLELFKIPDYDGFYWEVGVEEVSLAGGDDELEDEGYYDDDDDDRRRRNRNRDRSRSGRDNYDYDDDYGEESSLVGRPTSRRADPQSEGGGGGGGGLFGGGGGDDEEDEEAGEEVLALLLRVIISFPISGEEETLEFETIAPFTTDTLFEGVEGEGGEDGEGGDNPANGGQGNDRDNKDNNNNNNNNNRGRRNEAAEELFGTGGRR